MGNVPFVPRKTVKETLDALDDHYRALNRYKDEEKGTTNAEQVAFIQQTIAHEKKIIQMHVDNVTTILEASTPADLPTLIQQSIELSYKIYHCVSPNEEKQANRKTILDAIIATISKHQGADYIVNETAVRKYTLKQQLAEVESELHFYAKARHSRFGPPEYELNYQRYSYAKCKIEEELAKLG
jgi:hypothetical protein